MFMGVDPHKKWGGGLKLEGPRGSSEPLSTGLKVILIIACVDCLNALCKSINPVTVRIKSPTDATKMWHQTHTNHTDIFSNNNVCSLISVLKYIPP